ncbi:two component, sigma54 specific, transcriptional regulator, Fis family [Desulfovibrio sp. X2]|uniref:sigma-54 dependent transcriptional regulator n=1 Tax=Desulfovibrio sp. X2 TaxID=941449 RepID=UPI000358C9F2|nr:sigma-54 dependent transcriptional regulator [Desulfovibrio sp. X2]EPR44220.1 two component, sigma54 specific, transcriptional regulator, Fis family [Desulfovibrio sp. X2]
MAASILFVAQPAAVTAHFSRLREMGYEVGLAENLTGALSFIKKSRPLFVFSRVRLPGYRVENLLGESASAMGDFPPIVIFTEQGTADEARRLLELGAHDYWLDPVSLDKIEAVLPKTPPPAEEAPAAQAAPARKAEPQRGGAGEIIGRHPSVLRVLALAKQVAASKATVLISGESGTGKERFARYLHSLSDRADKPFVAINCAALPEHLLESELFGHEKGAFTGAIARKLGKFELASGGTILLDEISEMDMGLQAKLLRVLQEGEIDRVGGLDTVKVDVRVLATTNRKLDEYVQQGKFRQDLYFRLNVIPLRLPALRDRGDDVLLLAQWFVDGFRKAYGLPRLAFSEEAVEWMRSYDWPGNVRELQNLMERAVLLAGNGPIESRHFLLDPDAWEVPEEFEEAGQCTPGVCAAAPVADEAGGVGGEVLPLDEMERRMILKSLDKTQGNRTQAADLLGISVRTLRNKLAEYRKQGLEIP